MNNSHFGALAFKPTYLADIPLIYFAGRSGVTGMKQLSLIGGAAPGRDLASTPDNVKSDDVLSDGISQK